MCPCPAGPVRSADRSAEVCAGAAVLQRHGVQHAGPQQTGTLSLSLSAFLCVSLSVLSLPPLPRMSIPFSVMRGWRRWRDQVL